MYVFRSVVSEVTDPKRKRDIRKRGSLTEQILHPCITHILVPVFITIGYEPGLRYQSKPSSSLDLRIRIGRHFNGGKEDTTSAAAAAAVVNRSGL